MGSIVNCSPYAKAFFYFARANNSLDIVYKDARTIENAIKGDIKFRNFIQDKFINSNDKLNVLKEIFSNVSPETLQLLKILKNSHRLNHLHNILSGFINIYYKEKNITKVDITFATQVDETIIETIKEKITDNLKSEILATVHIDEKILGGFIISFDSKIYNASIANSLNLIKTKLLENS